MRNQPGIALSQDLLRTLEKYRNFISEISEGVWRLELHPPVPTNLPVEEQIDRYFEVGVMAEGNLTMARMYGLEKAEELSGLPLRALLIPDDPRNRDYLRAFVENGYRLQNAESVEKDRDGEIRYFSNNLVGVVEKDCLTGAWGTQRDITNFREMEKKLVDAAQVAGDANRAKTKFIANVSHEIRTPLSVILGFADLALDAKELEPETRSYIQAIRRNAQELAEMIGEVLDLSKIEASRIDVENVRFALAPFLNEVLSSLNLRAREKNLNLNLGVNGPLPKFIHSDPTKLRQILMNLLSNAIKFTERGHVTLSARLVSEPLAGRHIVLEFSVADSGIGIPEEQRDRLFLPFSQLQAASTSKYGGTGLGLNLSKQLAEALGGELTLLHSQVAKGSTFLLCVPGGVLEEELGAEAVSELITPQPAEPSACRMLQGKRVLLVEDSEDNQILISRYLSAVGIQVELANNGREGIDKAHAGEYDLIVMDIQMPGVDGHEAARTLRERGYDKPIIALTANAFKEDRERAFANGFSEYLTKPINRSALIRTLDERLSAMNLH